MLASAQTPAWTYPSLTETTCTACECSAAAPSNGVLSSSIIEYSTIYNHYGALKEGGGGGGGGGGGEGDLGSIAICQLAYDMCSSLV